MYDNADDNVRMYLYVIGLIADLLSPEADLHTVDRSRFGVVLSWLSAMVERELDGRRMPPPH